jgi:hypothetical protein
MSCNIWDTSRFTLSFHFLYWTSDNEHFHSKHLVPKEEIKRFAGRDSAYLAENLAI